jgi:hypothetical protein
LPIEKGGTGANNAEEAIRAIGAIPSGNSAPPLPNNDLNEVI